MLTPTVTEKPVLERAEEKHPVLRELGIKAIENYQPDRGYLEFWPAGEPGHPTAPRPDVLPIDSRGVEIFKKETRPTDVLGDVVSHDLVNTNPRLKKYYEDFEKSLTPEQQQTLRRQYQHAVSQGEERPFETWRQHSGLPAYFRGYAFEQWPAEDAASYYTPAQIEAFDEMNTYLRTGDTMDDMAPLLEKITAHPLFLRLLAPAGGG